MCQNPVASLLQSPPLKMDILIKMRETGPSSAASKRLGVMVVTLWVHKIEGRDRTCSTICGFQFSSYSRTSGSMTLENELWRLWFRVTRSLSSSMLRTKRWLIGLLLTFSCIYLDIYYCKGAMFRMTMSPVNNHDKNVYIRYDSEASAHR